MSRCRAQITAFSNTTGQAAARRCATRRRGAPRACSWPKGLRILAEARDSGRLPEIVAFSRRGRAASAGRRDHRRDRGGGRRGDRDQRRHPPQDVAARTIRRLLLGVYRQPDTALGRDRPRRRAAVDRRPGAARSRQSRHHPAHRRRGRRRRADPGRRLRRPLFGRGGARLDGRALHPGDRDGALGRVPRLAARRARASWSAPASRPTTTISAPRYAAPCFLLVGNEQQGLPADYEAECDLLVKIPMAGQGRQPQRGGGGRGHGLPGPGQLALREPRAPAPG